MRHDLARWPWLTVGPERIDIRTPFDPALVALLKDIGARWDAAGRAWHVPRALAGDLAERMPDINRLAIAAAGGPRGRANLFSDSPPIPLLPDYVYPRAGAARLPLELEAAARPGEKPDSWVAQIFATHPTKGWVRAFLDGALDYSRANKRQTRGIYRVYHLQAGPVYQIQERPDGRRREPRRRFLRVEDGAPSWMTEDEVMACLAR